MASEKSRYELKKLIDKAQSEERIINPREHFFAVINNEAFKEFQQRLFSADDIEKELPKDKK